MELSPILKLFQKIKEEGTFHDVNITLASKPHKDITGNIDIISLFLTHRCKYPQKDIC